MRLLLAIFLLFPSLAFASPTVSELDHGVSGGGVSSETTASLTPAAGSMLVIAVNIRGTSGGVTASGDGLSWSTYGPYGPESYTAYMGSAGEHWLLVGTGTVTNGTLTITATGGAVTNIAYDVMQVTGYNVTTPIAQQVGATGNGSTFSVTLSSTVSTSAIIASFGCGNTGSANVAGTGYTGFTNVTGQTGGLATMTNLLAEWRTGTVTTATETNAQGSNFGGLAIEISTAVIPPTGSGYKEILHGKEILQGKGSIK